MFGKEFNPMENTKGGRIKVETKPSAKDLLTCKPEEIVKLVQSLCKKHNLNDSSFANITEKEGEILIVTSYGTLVATPDLTEATLYAGNPVGFAKGRNATGHYLPPTH